MSEERKGGTTVTITVPERLDAAIDEASRFLDLTCGSALQREALLVALIERGARAVSAYDSSGDFRSVASVSVAELAEMLGIADLDAARKRSREARELQEQTTTRAVEVFADLAGLQQIDSRMRLDSAEAVGRYLEAIQQAMKAHPELVVSCLVAFVDTRKSPATYSPIVTTETIN